MAISPPLCNFGWPAPDFTLNDTDGKPLWERAIQQDAK